jgi:UDP-GlcNAc:undecaprenyl-phosphate GlcNAc-1-phosphate transferase
MDSIYYNLTVIIAFIASVAIAAFIIPALKLIAPKTGLLDIPNARKVHQNPVPVVGGLAIGITLIISLLVSPYFIEIINKYYIIISAALLLMLVGILDDKLNLSELEISWSNKRKQLKKYRNANAEWVEI